jgi:hypothetical protein
MKIFTKNTAITGTVTLDPANVTGNAVGFSVNFTSSISSNDIIILNNDIESRKQVKVVVNVNTSSLLTLESNTKFYGDGYINVPYNSNTITFTSNTYTLNLAANDVVKFEFDSSTITGKILSGSGKTYTINTSSATFTANANLVSYAVYPYFDNVSFEILKQIQE